MLYLTHSKSWQLWNCFAVEWLCLSVLQLCKYQASSIMTQFWNSKNKCLSCVVWLLWFMKTNAASNYHITQAERVNSKNEIRSNQFLRKMWFSPSPPIKSQTKELNGNYWKRCWPYRAVEPFTGHRILQAPRMPKYNIYTDVFLLKVNKTSEVSQDIKRDALIWSLHITACNNNDG